MLPLPKVLLLICDEAEKGTLQEILSPYAELTCVCDKREMRNVLEAENFDALFCARSLCMESWHEVLEDLRQQNPDLPVIILSRTAGEQEWLEVLEAGAFDLLGPPYYSQTVLPVLEHAVVSHEARVTRHSAETPQRKVS